MKVILLQDVKALGKKGEMVEVSDGYARNFILPKKVGIEANGANLNDLKLQKANEEKVAQEQLDEAKALGAKAILPSIRATTAPAKKLNYSAKTGSPMSLPVQVMPTSS